MNDSCRNFSLSPSCFSALDLALSPGFFFFFSSQPLKQVVLCHRRADNEASVLGCQNVGKEQKRVSLMWLCQQTIRQPVMLSGWPHTVLSVLSVRLVKIFCNARPVIRPLIDCHLPFVASTHPLASRLLSLWTDEGSDCSLNLWACTLGVEGLSSVFVCCWHSLMPWKQEPASQLRFADRCAECESCGDVCSEGPGWRLRNLWPSSSWQYHTISRLVVTKQRSQTTRFRSCLVRGPPCFLFQQQSTRLVSLSFFVFIYCSVRQRTGSLASLSQPQSEIRRF